MAGLENLWSRFSLDDEEEHGAEVPKPVEEVVHRLAGRFFTKRTLNVESVARTFKPLWKPTGKLKLRDLGDNILLFEFSDALDLARVLEFEPWTFDKNIVVFEQVNDVEEVPSLEFSRANFWVQLHNLPPTSLNQAIGKAIGNSIGKVIDVADPEDDGEGREFLRVRITIDIIKPLPRCRKLWSKGKQLGWVGLKYERLPNFCYWCARLTHGERKCEIWLKGKGSQKKDEQQFGDWMRAEPIRSSRKSIVVISGRARNNAPWWKKSGSKEKTPSTDIVNRQEPGSGQGAVFNKEPSSIQEVIMKDAVLSKPIKKGGKLSNIGRTVNSTSNSESTKLLAKSIQGLSVDKQDAKEPTLGHLAPPIYNGLVDANISHAEVAHIKPLLGDCTNQLRPVPQATPLRTFKKLSRNTIPNNEELSNESLLVKCFIAGAAKV